MRIEDLRETADLAHLNMESAELEKAFPAFEEMLSFFAAMQTAEADMAGKAAAAPANADRIEGMAASSRLVNAAYFRGDNPRADGGSPQTGEDMLNNAGERDGRFVVIPNVL